MAVISFISNLFILQNGVNSFFRYSVITIFADDADAPHNARITYSLSEDNSAESEHKKDVEYFRILNENSGEITLVNQIPPLVCKN